MEIRKQEELIKDQKRKNQDKLNNSEEIKTFQRELENIKKGRLKLLQEIHKSRLKEYKRRKKTGNKSQLEEQLKNWKKQGYDTRVLDKKFKLPQVEDIRDKIKKWKKQGYDTSILERR